MTSKYRITIIVSGRVVFAADCEAASQEIAMRYAIFLQTTLRIHGDARAVLV